MSRQLVGTVGLLILTGCASLEQSATRKPDLRDPAALLQFVDRVQIEMVNGSISAPFVAFLVDGLRLNGQIGKTNIGTNSVDVGFQAFAYYVVADMPLGRFGNTNSTEEGFERVKSILASAQQTGRLATVSGLSGKEVVDGLSIAAKAAESLDYTSDDWRLQFDSNVAKLRQSIPGVGPKTVIKCQKAATK